MLKHCAVGETTGSDVFELSAELCCTAPHKFEVIKDSLAQTEGTGMEKGGDKIGAVGAKWETTGSGCATLDLIKPLSGVSVVAVSHL
jgi:hypothetical protein